MCVYLYIYIYIYVYIYIYIYVHMHVVGGAQATHVTGAQAVFEKGCPASLAVLQLVPLRSESRAPTAISLLIPNSVDPLAMILAERRTHNALLASCHAPPGRSCEKATD